MCHDVPTQWKIFSASWSDQESLLFAIASSWRSALYGWLTSPPGWPPMMSVIINDSVFSPAWGVWLKKSSGSSCIHFSATVFQLLIWNLVVILVLPHMWVSHEEGCGWQDAGALGKKVKDGVKLLGRGSEKLSLPLNIEVRLSDFQSAVCGRTIVHVNKT